MRHWHFLKSTCDIGPPYQHPRQRAPDAAVSRPPDRQTPVAATNFRRRGHVTQRDAVGDRRQSAPCQQSWGGMGRERGVGIAGWDVHLSIPGQLHVFSIRGPYSMACSPNSSQLKPQVRRSHHGRSFREIYS